MGSIYGIPSTRVSDLYVRQTLLGQVAYNQAELFRLQEQLSTGRRFQLPSEAPTAAQQASDLQRLIARKTQGKANLQASQSYLAATDSALRSVSDLAASARAEALGATGTLVSDQQRTAATQQVAQILQQMMSVANQDFRGRYLFAGSETAALPFSIDIAGLVSFNGNEVTLQSFADPGLAFNTNVSATEAFGAVSADLRGSVDLNPALTADTPLASLRGGSGVALGSISISDGTTSAVVDLSDASTIGDVAAKIYAQSPFGRHLQVEIRGDGLWLHVDNGGALTISEVAAGTTARDLGIATTSAVPSDTMVGQDLDPTLNATTRLDNVLGRRARVVMRATAASGNVLFESGDNGAADNGVQVQFVNDAAVQKGSEVVQYDSGARTLTVRIAQSQSTANDVVSAVHAAFLSGDSPLDAQLDPSQPQRAGEGAVDVGSGVAAGGSGENLDRTSGLRLANSDETYTVDLAAADTVEDLLNAINLSGAGMLAEINLGQRGIDIRSRVSGAEFGIGENGGATATQLGVRSLTASTRLDDLNHGQGIDEPAAAGVDFTITKADGSQLAIDVNGAATMQDVLDRINQDPNNDPANPLIARLSLYGNGIELFDASTGASTLTITRASGNRVAERLGLLAAGENQRTADPATPNEITGSDPNPREAEGLFSALVLLQRALEENDQPGIARAVAMLDAGASQLNLTQATVGAQQQAISSMLDRNASETVELESNLSQEMDADYAAVVSEFTARQLAYQASLKTTATVFQMSLLDYL